MTGMTLDEAVKWLRAHVGDLRSAAQFLRESPWGAKLAANVAAMDRAADKGTLAIAALEAAREDAERYRWLRDKCDRWDGGLVVAEVTEFSLSSWSGDNLNAAIDQARGKGEP